MEQWQKLLSRSVVKVEDLPFLPYTSEEYKEKLEKVAEIFPIRINSYFMEQIQNGNDALWKQVVPTLEELDDFISEEELLESDPLNEESDMPVPELVHRYPDRVLLMVNNQCPIICRFCTRKRKIGFPGIVTRETLRQGIEYIAEHTEIRDVILSGGDPLLVPDKELERILGELRAIPHLEIIRIGTRVPGTLPQRVTEDLCAMLKKYHPLYFNIHFNQIRVKPYYIYQADMTLGTNHFRTTVEKGLEIISQLQGHTSGMGVPYYVIDAPGGGGKVRLLPNSVIEHNDNEVIIRNFEGKVYRYPQPKSNGHKPSTNGNIPQSTVCEMTAG
jgi:lysine 2,3-aminomutase